MLDELQECIPDPRWEGERELKELLEEFLREQPLEQRKLFLRRYWYGETIDELSQAFGYSPSRVTGMLFRTRKRLEKYLQKEGYTV